MRRLHFLSVVAREAEYRPRYSLVYTDYYSSN